MQPYTLDDQQHATVLAALRLYQTINFGDRDDSGISDIATNCGALVALDAEGIDELCEHLQNGESMAMRAVWEQLTRDGHFIEQLGGILNSLADLRTKIAERYSKEGMSPVQQKCWDDLNHPDPDADSAEVDSFCAGLDTKLESMSDTEIQKSLDDVAMPGDDGEPCKECGEPTDDGEGYDGRCGNCADRASCSHCGDPIEDGGSDGECSDCAEKAVEAASKRGMATFPKAGLTVRTFEVPDLFNAEVGEFVVTENEPGSSHPPSDWVAWEVTRTFTKHGRKFVDTVLDTSASATVSAGKHHNLALAWTNIKRMVGDA